ncbi:MAG: hypothetical protein H6Q52_2173 [Deltaproteobacteria bacterium]|nr:hypothetical protein [Deltaproteobacteria bacterium]
MIFLFLRFTSYVLRSLRLSGIENWSFYVYDKTVNVFFFFLRFTIYVLRHFKEGYMKEWNDRAKRLDLSDKPLTRALVNKALRDIETIERNYGFTLNTGDSLDSMIETAIVADTLCLLLPPLNAAQGPDRADGVFPRDRLLTFVCAIWFFTAMIPRLEEEGHSMDIARLSGRIGTVLFAPYGEENGAGLVKIGIQYWKELGIRAPSPVIEWHKAFAQMIFIHYETLINDTIDLGDLDLDSTIGKMVTVFFSMSFSLPELN